MKGSKGATSALVDDPNDRSAGDAGHPESLVGWIERRIMAHGAQTWRADSLASELVGNAKVAKLLRKKHWVIMQIFRHYAVSSHTLHAPKVFVETDADGKVVEQATLAQTRRQGAAHRTDDHGEHAYMVVEHPQHTMELQEWRNFLRHFGIMGNEQRGYEFKGIIAEAQAVQVFRSANFGTAADGDTETLCLAEFEEALCRVALIMFPLEDLHERIRLLGENPIATFSDGHSNKMAARLFDKMRPRRSVLGPRPGIAAAGGGGDCTATTDAPFRSDHSEPAAHKLVSWKATRTDEFGGVGETGQAGESGEPGESAAAAAMAAAAESAELALSSAQRHRQRRRVSTVGCRENECECECECECPIYAPQR